MTTHSKANQQKRGLCEVGATFIDAILRAIMGDDNQHGAKTSQMYTLVLKELGPRPRTSLSLPPLAPARAEAICSSLPQKALAIYQVETEGQQHILTHVKKL